MNMQGLLRRSYERYADSVAVADADDVSRSLSYRELQFQATALAHRFAEAGVKPGDRIVIALGNCVDYFVAEHAIFLGGFVRVALSHHSHPDEVTYILDDCAASAVVTTAEFAGSLDLAGRESLEVVVLVEELPSLTSRWSGGVEEIGHAELSADTPVVS